jgi:hypothetical protein
MGFANPLLFLGDRETGKELSASVRPRWDIEDASENIGNFESNQAERHIGEASALLRKLFHIRGNVGIKHV